MRIAARRAANGTLPRRWELMNKHLRADPLSKLFPQIEQVRIELIFSDPGTLLPSPSPQLHTLFAPAPAFFRFACPCADCDGDFDLTDAVTALLSGMDERRPAASFMGHASCLGVRFRDHASHESSCSMQLSYQLVAERRRG